jgi:hypothetical protein
MSHILLIEGADGDTVDAHTVCSDSCHRSLAVKLNVPYKGWFGCVELEFNDYCQSCGELIHGVEGPYEFHNTVCEDTTCELCSDERKLQLELSSV